MTSAAWTWTCGVRGGVLAAVLVAAMAAAPVAAQERDSRLSKRVEKEFMVTKSALVGLWNPDPSARTDMAGMRRHEFFAETIYD